ncbi:hypothetical protein KSP39_PZI021011 [Platanthera zijinensis]|uniref:Choline monooxygenase, chloroplastic n=1 Tax=Platanthera zijinensis TaxID=2320716 RepID=A0AAP0FVA4_9ASPA
MSTPSSSPEAAMTFAEGLLLRSLRLRPKSLYSPSQPFSTVRRPPSSRLGVSRSTLPFSTEEKGGKGASSAGDVCRLLDYFNPTIPITEALTPPSSWYTDSSFLSLEFERVFFRGWQVVGCSQQVKSPNDFFTGRLGNVEFVVCRDTSGELHAFHNVCRHHASILAYGSGRRSCFECPYHGWTYGLDGVLLKANRITGIKNFNKNDFGLLPLNVSSWGPFVLINVGKSIDIKQKNSSGVGNEWLGSASEILSTNGIDTSLEYVCRRKYIIECNWKVFCDNYLDGGYHVLYAHGDLAAGLKLDSYTTNIYEKVSIQSCESAPTERDDLDRLGAKALYAFIYPNFMINRYGPWMDTNLALPLGPNKCEVIFDYFLDPALMKDKEFIERSLKESEMVTKIASIGIILIKQVQELIEQAIFSSGTFARVSYELHYIHVRNHGTPSTWIIVDI